MQGAIAAGTFADKLSVAGHALKTVLSDDLGLRGVANARSSRRVVAQPPRVKRTPIVRGRRIRPRRAVLDVFVTSPGAIDTMLSYRL